MDHAITCGLGVVDGVDFEALVASVRSSSTTPKGPLKGGTPSSSANGHDPPSNRTKTLRFTPSDPCVVDETVGPRDLRERRCDRRSTFDASRLVQTPWFRYGVTCRSSTRIRPFPCRRWCVVCTKTTNPTTCIACLGHETWKQLASRSVHGWLYRRTRTGQWLCIGRVRSAESEHTHGEGEKRWRVA